MSEDLSSATKPIDTPKRILALDGGGVRALVALGFLERIEALLKTEYGDAGFRLSDHFDLIGGTSSGALIGTGLAMGLKVAEVIELSKRVSSQAFASPGWTGGLLSPKYDAETLVNAIRSSIGDETLGSEKLLTGLAIVAKRLDTGSAWVFHNNPNGKFFRPQDSNDFIANADLPLYELLRASAAAPTYFEPERIRVAPGVEGLFVDGGVSPFNNPALLLLMMVTTPGYGYDWQTGVDALNLISVGTGIGGASRTADSLESLPSAFFAAVSLESMITDGQWHAQSVLQWLGECEDPWEIDSEAGTFMSSNLMPQKLLRYQRYDLRLERKWLEKEVDTCLDSATLEKLVRLDDAQSADELLSLARCGAQNQVKIRHLV